MSAHVTIRSDVTEILTKHRALTKHLREELSYDEPNAIYSQSYKRGRWDGRIRYFRQGKVPSGLTARALEIIYQHLKPDDVKVVDLTPKHTYSTTQLNAELRSEYQLPAVEAILKAKRGIIYAPPRAGKTVIAAAVIARKFATPTLFIVERLVLQEQTIQALQKRLPNIKIGRLGGSIHNIGDVTVCTIQTLLKAYRDELSAQKFSLNVVEDEETEELDESTAEKIRELNETAKMVVVDETHHAVATSYAAVLAKQVEREYLIGLSGTPWVAIDDPTKWQSEIRIGQNIQLEATIGPIIYEVRYDLLIKLGYLVPPICYFINIPRQKGLPNEWAELYKAYICDEKSIRNKVIAQVAKRYVEQNRPVLIVVKRIDHGIALENLIYGSMFLYGKDPEAVRREAIANLRSKKVKCIISTILGEGVDIPELEVVINAEAGRSPQKCLQRQRAMTSAAGKDVCVYIDIFDHNGTFYSQSQYRYNLLSSIPGFTVKKIDAPKY